MTENNSSNVKRWIVTDEYIGFRLDKALSQAFDELSRARVQNLINGAAVKLNGFVCTQTSKKVAAGDLIEFVIPPLIESHLLPEDIPLNVLYEDQDILVINKPAGLVVHPGAGNYSGTLVNALLHYCGKTLSGIGGVSRPGIVHRLDKDTTGLMIVAKHDLAHGGLSKQLAKRSLSRKYKALVLGVPTPLKGFVDQPIGRHPTKRTKMSIRYNTGKEARTYYHVIRSYRQACSIVECRLESGRTHQIRVHMQHIKYPLIGDITYGPQSTAVKSLFKKSGYDEKVIHEVLTFPRQALHAYEITFIHPVSNEQMTFQQQIPEDISNLIKNL